MLDVPNGDFCGKRKLALRASGGMPADAVAGGIDLAFGGEPLGFVGGVRSAPIAPTTFVFGGGSALRTRNG